MVLAVGVACGQVLGGLIVGADLFGLGWRPALLLNVPVGLTLLAVVRRTRQEPVGPAVTRLDLAGAGLLAAAISAVIVPMVFGRQQQWPAWCVLLLPAGIRGPAGFVRYERRVIEAGGQPLLDLRALRPPGVRAGLAACFLVMGAYTAFVFTLTLHLQNGLGFTASRAGLAFAPYTAGFAIVSLAWTRLPARTARLLPVLGPVLFAAALGALLAVAGTRWPLLSTATLLICAGAGHAASFSPLFARLAGLIGPATARRCPPWATPAP